MNIESTNDQLTDNTAITYSECYAQVFSRLFFGDCLIESDKIESGSVDLILTDLPYGNMKGLDAEPIKSNNNKNYVAGGGYKKGYGWDSTIEPKKVYEIANRILRKNGKMVLFCQEPFTTLLITEAIPNIPFSYRAIWEKNDFANCLFAKKAMVNYYEDILVFSKTHDLERSHPLIDYFMAELEKTKMNQSDINRLLGNKMGGIILPMGFNSAYQQKRITLSCKQQDIFKSHIPK